MKLFKELFGRIWALWASVMFVLTMLVFFIPFLLFSHYKKDPLKTYRFISLSRVWMDIFLFTIGCPLKVKGREHFIAGQNYIVVCNHNSFMDVPVSSPSIPGGNKTIAKVEISKVPLFGLLYKTGSILVNRKSDSSRKDSYMKMKEVLAMGLHMCIYPEGTRNISDKPLNTFQNGAFRLAKDTGKAIVPALIFNTRKVLPAGKIFYAMPHRLQIHFLPPVE
ncbi:MAG: 1-acyl-sn-glycerol-3-phosphate acyltransferase, partial [Chitinophagaceae bacterium]|nr:1-acyl-sn-glycerol-3-phosphate acyltransferase [Chitinophagaceae bacterium]